MPAETSSGSFASLSGIRVLVVDDDDDALDLLTFVLERCGATVTPARSAADALAALDRTLPDVLVSDIGMPDQDGYALIGAMRARPAEHGGTVPAIAYSAFTRAEDRQRALDAGFNAFLAKPARLEELVSLIARLCVLT